MRKIWVPFLMVWFMIVPAAVAQELETRQWEIEAPAGSEMDLNLEVVVYYGTEKTPVVLRSITDPLKLTAQRVEYYRQEERFFAQGKVVIEGEDAGPTPSHFLVTGEEVVYLAAEGLLKFSQGGTVQRDDVSLKAGKIFITLDEQTESMEVTSFEATNGFTLLNSEGEMTGNILKGDTNQGMVEAIGDLRFQYGEISGEADQAVYFEGDGEIHLLGTPFIYREKDYITGESIIYNLKTEKAMVFGPVRTRLYR